MRDYGAEELISDNFRASTNAPLGSPRELKRPGDTRQPQDRQGAVSISA
jgi:hypothetical protein